ncbi:putative phosphoribosyltransferase [Campylobacter showae]|uniref:Phosphoribosyl transferase domain protein n=2 Tax=Campylobacter showae TaxID=204 RepID=C6RHD0_9BACT|nr:AAA family ATPase [Campylobacter showae]EET79147.1 phosphoribosyl transferase domain protein [Campylobacter showae RM3277]QCD49678.1 putative phosphoribosyltransferase [Campylobacter showae]
MKIAIYGITGAGKDYLIDKLVNSLNLKALHIKGSTELYRLAKEKFGKNFKELNGCQKDELRKNDFIKLVKACELENDIVFVDGHYAFKKDDGFEVVFTDADKECYDHFFYLNTSSKNIIKWSHKNILDKHGINADENFINKWKKFEISQMSKICSTMQKELVILDEDSVTAIEFMRDWIWQFYDKFDYPNIAERFVEKLLCEQNISKVIISDCDKTLSVNDPTYAYCDFLGIKKEELKRLFEGDIYTSYQFFKARKMLLNFNTSDIKKAKAYALSKVQISKEVDEFIKSKFKERHFIAITCGIFDIWNELLKDNTILLGNYQKEENFFITPLLKKYITKELRKNNISVVALGDSMTDIFMLNEADNAYVVAHQKPNDSLEKYLAEHQDGNIVQIFAGEKQYRTMQYIKNEQLKIYDLQSKSKDDELDSLIAKCKSNSRVGGAKLRKAHQRLGELMARRLCDEDDRFAVLALMRAGMPYAMGIADGLEAAGKKVAIFFIEKDIDEILIESIKDRRVLIVDAVVNSGETLYKILNKLPLDSIITATVVPENIPLKVFEILKRNRLFTVRISPNRYKGEKVMRIENGKGPDTGDRLFGTMEL